LAGLIFVRKEFLVAVLVSGIANTLFQQSVAIRISSYIPGMGILGRMLAVASSLADTGENTFKEIEVLQKYKKFINSLQKKFGWLLLQTHRQDELSASIIAYINHLLLVNVIVFFTAAKYVEKHKRELIEIFEAIGSLDASMAIAEYISTETCCCAELVDENKIEVVSLYHPILEHPISNAFSLSNHSCLITGSNMAGKTTFIKTVGVNLVLTRTLGFCHALSALFPTASVLTTICRGDDLKYDKSYYYVEIETILEFIKAAESNQRYVFLIDEIFRGTNTVERLAASSSVLKYLGNRGMVLVTTHDIELEYMLDERYRMFHFQEQIEENRHFFDYKIKLGACKSRNAIKLLELTGYPVEITTEAYATSFQLSNESKKLGK
jgi:DNA mismatch repair ATPase MutS